jgi:NADPH2 dehydrogenase
MFMKTKHLNKFSAFTFKNGLAAKNRVVVPAMASQSATLSGHATEETVKHYSNLAKSGAGIIFVEYTFVHHSGRSEENQLGIDNDLQILGLSKIAKAIKDQGSIAGIQLTHAGGKTTRDLTNGFLMGPSNEAVPVKDQLMEIPDAMEMSEINLWKEAFLMSTKRAVHAGFNLIELHAAHGYGLNQWISPITNKREDHFGGALLNRIRLLSEIIQTIKLSFPELLLSVRIPGRDFLEEGISSEDAILIAKHLEFLGVDIINVSSGIGGWRRPRERLGEGYLVDEACAIQKNVNIPVIGVGGIETGNYIDQIMSTGDIAFAAVGRAILSDPEGWGVKNLLDKSFGIINRKNQGVTMKLKLNDIFIASTLFVILGIGQVNASNINEVCISRDGRTRVVIEQFGKENISGIEVFFDDELIKRDNQLFGPNYCHVQGVVFEGKLLSYGGCGPSDREKNKTVFDRKTGQSWNLNNFDCRYL